MLSPCLKTVLTDGCTVTCVFGNNPKDLFSTWSRMQGGKKEGDKLPRELSNLCESVLYIVVPLVYLELILGPLGLNLFYCKHKYL